MLEPGVEVTFTKHRHQDRHRAGRLGHGGNVFFPDAVEGVRAQDPAIRGNADQWFVASHV
jgi:hypothetical protein